jgi:uncharacterized protein YbbC (DUF1343 family)
MIFSENVEEYANYVREVLERLRQYSLYVKLSKCKFLVEEVDFLVYYIEVVGVSIDISRVIAI